MVNNADVPVDPENEAYEMPPEVNPRWVLLWMRVEEDTSRVAHLGSISLARAGALSCTNMVLWAKSPEAQSWEPENPLLFASEGV